MVRIDETLQRVKRQPVIPCLSAGGKLATAWYRLENQAPLKDALPAQARLFRLEQAQGERDRGGNVIGLASLWHPHWRNTCFDRAYAG